MQPDLHRCNLANTALASLALSGCLELPRAEQPKVVLCRVTKRGRAASRLSSQFGHG